MKYEIRRKLKIVRSSSLLSFLIKYRKFVAVFRAQIKDCLLEIWQKHIIEIGILFLPFKQVKVDMYMAIKSKGKGFCFPGDFAPETAHPSFESVSPLVEFLVRTQEHVKL